MYKIIKFAHTIQEANTCFKSCELGGLIDSEAALASKVEIVLLRNLQFNVRLVFDKVPRYWYRFCFVNNAKKRGLEAVQVVKFIAQKKRTMTTC